METVIKKINLSSDSLIALVLIILQSVFLLVNFTSGFNLFLYIIVAIITLVVSCLKPRASLYALLVLLLIFAKFFSLQSLWLAEVEYKIYLVDIFLIGIIFNLIIRLLSGKIKWQIRATDIWLIFFMFLAVVYFILSLSYWNGMFNLAFSSLKNYLFYPLLFFITLFLIDSREHLYRLFNFFILGSVIIIGFIIYGLIVGQGLWTAITPLSTFGSRLLDFDHAFYLCLASLSGLAYLIIKPDRWSKWWQILLFIFAIGIIGSLMRHLWIALAVAVLFMYFLAKIQRCQLRQVAVKYLAVVGIILSVSAMLVVNLPNN